jgi:hypothetical protein
MENSIPCGEVNGVRLFMHLSLPLFLILLATDFELMPSELIKLVLFICIALFLHLFAQLSSILLKNPEQSGGAPTPSNDTLGLARLREIFGKRYSALILFPFGGYWVHSSRQDALDRQQHHSLLAFCFAGVAVNGLIALYMLGKGFSFHAPTLTLSLAKDQLLWSNAWLALINLIPCPPFAMGLYLFYRKPQWRETCVRITQTICVAGALLCSLGQLFSVVLVFFLGLLHSFRAVVIVRAQQQGAGQNAGDLMCPMAKLEPLPAQGRVIETLDILERSIHDFFPILQGRDTLGIVERNSILTAVSQGKGDEPVASLLSGNIRLISSTTPITEVLAEFSPFEESLCLVQHPEEKLVVGILPTSRITNVLCIRAIEKESSGD